MKTGVGEGERKKEGKRGREIREISTHYILNLISYICQL